MLPAPVEAPSGEHPTALSRLPCPEGAANTGKAAHDQGIVAVLGGASPSKTSGARDRALLRAAETGTRADREAATDQVALVLRLNAMT